MAAKDRKAATQVGCNHAFAGLLRHFDHFGLDVKGKRLFLTAEDHKTVEVFI